MIHALSAWFTRNPVAANIVMAVVLIAGFFSLRSMRIEGFPALPTNSVTITTVYPGASPQQVDEGVTRKIERALEGMPGVKRVSSYSDTDLSTVWVQKTSRFDINRFQNEIQARIDAIATFPSRAERPSIERDEFTIEALLVQVYGDTDERTLQRVARGVRSELLAHPGISRITEFGMLSYEVRIEIDLNRIRAFGMTTDDIALALDRASVEYQSGSIVSEGGSVTIRADRVADEYQDFREIPVLSGTDGTQVLLGDVATIVDGFVETDGGFARYQGTPSVGFQVFSSARGHVLEVSDAAHEVVDRLRPTMPRGVELDIWGETSPYMRARLTLLANNALQGLLIVFAILAVFLNFRLALWIAAGIPISLAGTFLIMGEQFLGRSLNDISTFGMIVVLGILVDDAIIVGESVFDTRRTIRDPIEGTIEGVHRVSTATVFGAFTTIAAFFPLLLINNDIGKLFAGFAVVVIISLLMSLAESKLILPAHLARVPIDFDSTSDRSPRARGVGGAIARVYRALQGAAQGALNRVNTRLYGPALRGALRNRYAVLVAFLAIAGVTATLVTNGWVRTVFFPEVPGQFIQVQLTMRPGGPEQLTADNVAALEEAARRLNRDALERGESEHPPIARLMAAMSSRYDGLLIAELQPEERRELSTDETINRWRAVAGTLEGVDELQFSGSFETGGGFEIALAAQDHEILAPASDIVVERLSALRGVSDVRSNANDGDPEIRLRLREEGRHLGLSTADLAQQIGNAYGGLEVQRIRRGSDEVKVRVQLAAENRRYIGDLLRTPIRLPSGDFVNLLHVATVESGYAPTTVYRENGRRVVQIKASLDREVVAPSEAFAWIESQIVPEVATRYPGVQIRGAGELEEIDEMGSGLKRALVMIVILIYALLAIPLKSYTQPLVIMSVVPFGFVGAILGHLVMGFPLSVLSFFGMLAVMGIVVNDSLVLLTRYHEIREEGTPVNHAMIEAGRSRFRAIVLTTMTTVLGLVPLLSETSEQALYLVPAAISLAFGELVATPITLFIVPILVAIKNDIALLFRRRDLPEALDA